MNITPGSGRRNARPWRRLAGVSSSRILEQRSNEDAKGEHKLQETDRGALRFREPEARKSTTVAGLLTSLSDSIRHNRRRQRGVRGSRQDGPGHGDRQHTGADLVHALGIADFVGEGNDFEGSRMGAICRIPEDLQTEHSEQRVTEVSNHPNLSTKKVKGVKP